MLTSMGTNILADLLVFLLFLISRRVIDNKAFLPYHLLKYQLKHKVSKLSNVYQRLCSLYFESLAIFSLFRHIHTKDDPDFQHAYNRTYLFLSDNDILCNESRFLFDHGIISRWNFWHYRGNKMFTKFTWSQIIHLSSILSKFWDGCLHLN